MKDGYAAETANFFKLSYNSKLIIVLAVFFKFQWIT